MNSRTSVGKENKPFVVPATPNLKQLGYGTGVGVFHVDRSPRNGHSSSPWALKKILSKQNEHWKKTMTERLRNEAEILRKLNHPNIIGFRAFVKTKDGRECLAMEECHTSLGDMLEENEEYLSSKIVQKIAIEVAKGLDYIHNVAHLLHGDIKSHNILIKGDFDAIKLCDFGVSLPLTPEGHFDEAQAAKGATYVGTQFWSAPEVLPHKIEKIIITDRADVFSYGLTIWEMLTNSVPFTNVLDESSSSNFDADAYEEMIDEIIGTRPEIPEYVTKNRKLKNIVTLFNACTEEDYTKRYSAKQILDFCEKYKF